MAEMKEYEATYGNGNKTTLLLSDDDVESYGKNGVELKQVKGGVKADYQARSEQRQADQAADDKAEADKEKGVSTTGAKATDPANKSAAPSDK